jgi:glutamyl-tRNA synthetase
VIRLKAPNEGETVIDDLVQGRVTWQNKELDDLVLLRSDGTPTYMLGVVVDDHDMAVTHIIRGDDHLTNGARQAQIYEALGWPIPKMAHIPLIHGPDGAKLSKRHGALGVEAYRAMGYLPAAMRNYLVRLGWSHGDQEIFTTEELLSLFDLNRVGRSAARFDITKLESLNGLYIRQASDQELIDALEKFLPELPDGAALAPRFKLLRRQIAAIMPGLKERAKTLIELVDGTRFLLDERPLKIEDKAKAILTPEARAMLKRTIAMLEKTEWQAGPLDAAVRTLADDEKVKLAAVAQPLRAALTGKSTSTGIFDVLIALGKDESLARLRDQAGVAAAA